MKRINSYNEKLYPDIEDKTYWSCKIEYSLYEGVLSKDENEKTKILPCDTDIQFAEIAKHVYDRTKIKCIHFTQIH